MIMLTLFSCLLGIFFLAFFLSSRRDLKRGVALVLFCLPAYLVRFSLLGIPTTVLEIMIYLLLAAGLARKDRSNFPGIKNLLQEDKLLAAGLMLLLAGAFLSTLCSSDLRTSLGALKGWFFDPLLFFLVYVRVVCSEEEVRATLRALACSGGAVALVALLYALAGALTFDGRLSAFYESPNYLAMQLAPALLTAFYLFTREKEKMYGALCFLMLGVLFLTKSYGALLGVAAALLIFFYKWYGERKSPLGPGAKKRLLLALILGLLAFLFLSGQKYELIVHSAQRSSLHSRLMIWDASRLMLQDSPLVGIGPGTFQSVYLSYQSRFATPYLEWAVAQPHNTPLAFALQTGLVGLLGFLFLLLWLLGRARTNPIVLLLFSYFVVHGLADTLYWKNDLSVLFFLMLGLAYAGKKKQPIKTEVPSGAA